MRVSLDQRTGTAKASDLLGDDLELLLREINDFCGTNLARREVIPKILENYILYVAKTGNTVFPWQHIRALYRWKLQSSIAVFSGEPMQMEETVFNRFDGFRSAPFTIQRLSELITDPKRHYKLKEKFLFALEKAVYVVSTVEPTSPDELEINGTAEQSEDNGTHHPGILNSTYEVVTSMAEDVSLTGDSTTSFPISVTESDDLSLEEDGKGDASDIIILECRTIEPEEAARTLPAQIEEVEHLTHDELQLHKDSEMEASEDNSVGHLEPMESSTIEDLKSMTSEEADSGSSSCFPTTTANSLILASNTLSYDTVDSGGPLEKTNDTSRTSENVLKNTVSDPITTTMIPSSEERKLPAVREQALVEDVSEESAPDSTSTDKRECNIPEIDSST